MVGFTFASWALLLLAASLTAPLPTHAEGTRGATTFGSLTIETAKEMRDNEEEAIECNQPPCHDNRGPPTSGGSSSSHTRQASGSGVGSFCDTGSGSGNVFEWSTPCTSSANFCSVPDGKCDIGEAGTCQAKPAVCTMEYAPVCGCDREIHGNKCVANGSGVNVWHDGECEAGNSCSGTQPCTNTEHYFCKMPGGLCGEPLGRQWTPHLECSEYGSHIGCNSSWQPVCGCDGKVYSNSCSANYQNGVNYLCTLNPDGDARPGGDCDCATMSW